MLKSNFRQPSALTVCFHKEPGLHLYYDIDHQDKIIAVGGDWDAFAKENSGESALAYKVIGTKIWDQIVDFETRSYLNAFFFASRQKQVEIATTYRCDAPDQPRLYKMRVTPFSLNDLALRISHEPLEPTMIDMDASKLTWEDSECVPKCSICCAFKVGDEWIDPFTRPDIRFFAHGHVVCTSCKRGAGAELRHCGSNIQTQEQASSSSAC